MSNVPKGGAPDFRPIMIPTGKLEAQGEGEKAVEVTKAPSDRKLAKMVETGELTVGGTLLHEATPQSFKVEEYVKDIQERKVKIGEKEKKGFAVVNKMKNAFQRVKNALRREGFHTDKELLDRAGFKLLLNQVGELATYPLTSKQEEQYAAYQNLRAEKHFSVFNDADLEALLKAGESVSVSTTEMFGADAVEVKNSVTGTAVHSSYIEESGRNKRAEAAKEAGLVGNDFNPMADGLDGCCDIVVDNPQKGLIVLADLAGHNDPVKRIQGEGPITELARMVAEEPGPDVYQNWKTAPKGGKLLDKVGINSTITIAKIGNFRGVNGVYTTQKGDNDTYIVEADGKLRKVPHSATNANANIDDDRPLETKFNPARKGDKGVLVLTDGTTNFLNENEIQDLWGKANGNSAKFFELCEECKLGKLKGVEFDGRKPKPGTGTPPNIIQADGKFPDGTKVYQKAEKGNSDDVSFAYQEFPDGFVPQEEFTHFNDLSKQTLVELAANGDATAKLFLSLKEATAASIARKASKYMGILLDPNRVENQKAQARNSMKPLLEELAVGNLFEFLDTETLAQLSKLQPLATFHVEVPGMKGVSFAHGDVTVPMFERPAGEKLFAGNATNPRIAARGTHGLNKAFVEKTNREDWVKTRSEQPRVSTFSRDRLKPGQAALGPQIGNDASFQVIHLLGPKLDKDTTVRDLDGLQLEVQNAYEAAFQLAVDQGAKFVQMPQISGGIYMQNASDEVKARWPDMINQAFVNAAQKFTGEGEGKLTKVCMVLPLDHDIPDTAQWAQPVPAYDELMAERQEQTSAETEDLSASSFEPMPTDVDVNADTPLETLKEMAQEGNWDAKLELGNRYLVISEAKEPILTGESFPYDRFKTSAAQVFADIATDSNADPEVREKARQAILDNELLGLVDPSIQERIKRGGRAVAEELFAAAQPKPMEETYFEQAPDPKPAADKAFADFRTLNAELSKVTDEKGLKEGLVKLNALKETWAKGNPNPSGKATMERGEMESVIQIMEGKIARATRLQAMLEKYQQTLESVQGQVNRIMGDARLSPKEKRDQVQTFVAGPEFQGLKEDELNLSLQKVPGKREYAFSLNRLLRITDADAFVAAWQKM